MTKISGIKNRKSFPISLLILVALTACTSVLKRQIAFTAKENLVSFYDEKTCSVEQCSEKTYDLTNPTEKNELIANLKALSEKSESLKEQAPNSLYMDELIRFHLGHASISRGAELALSVLKNEPERKQAQQLAEIFYAIKNNFRPPLDTEFEILMLPIEFLKRSYYNKVDKDECSDESYLKNPEPSTFWQPLNEDISKTDLYTGFGRQTANQYSNVVCQYDKAKSGWGMNPGFHVQCGEKRFKVKIGHEVFSGSFNTRLYWALGYHVPIIDFVEIPVIDYSRRLFTEFNSRRIENFKFKLAGKKAYQYEHTKYYSPFDFIKHVVLLDGSRISSSDLKKKLFINSEIEKPEVDPENYNKEFESQIKHIVFLPSSYLEKNSDVEVGAWRYDQLNHQNQRELRGMQLLAAWVGNFDMRMDNTRLLYTKDSYAMKHALVDVGSGLGTSHFLPFKTSSAVDEMPWQVTESYYDAHGEGGVTERLQITGLMNIEVNQAFKKMSFQDGQWMVNKLCQLTDDQIKAALIAAGFTSAEARLAYEKLIHRRTKMIRDFELEKDLAACLRATNTNLNYSEVNDGPFQAKLKSGEIVKARSSATTIRKGRLNKD